MICCTPNTQVHNLDKALNSNNASLTSPTALNNRLTTLHRQLATLTAPFQGAIQEKYIFKLTSVDHQYTQAMKSNMDFLLYDLSNLRTVNKTALQILNSHAAVSTPLPASPPNSLIHTQTTPPPSASLKPPKLVTENSSGQSYDFYPWLSSVLNGFSLTRCDDPVKLVLTLQAIP